MTAGDGPENTPTVGDAAPSLPPPARMVPPVPSSPVGHRPDGRDAMFISLGSVVAVGLLGVLLIVPLVLVGGAKAFTDPDVGALLAVGLLLAEILGILAAVGLFGLRRGLRWSDMGLRAAGGGRWYGIAVVVGGLVLPLVASLASLLLQELGVEPPDLIKAVKAMEDYPGVLAFMAILAVGPGPLVEEILFRGVVFDWLRRRFGVGSGLLASSVLFGLAHMAPANMLVTGLVGLGLGLLYQASGSLWVAVLAHGVYNGIAVLTVAVGVHMTN